MTHVVPKDTKHDHAGDGARGARIRADIQGLRAIAVGVVLVYHLWPDALPGGYIGVDVFFVISGFLITGHILRELQQEGTVDLPRFWARRARRLLPAALLVLLLTLAAVWIIAPSGFIPSFLAQIGASAAYVQNWLLSAEAVNYMANADQVSPVQHYWSLSVEEQFYLLWPVLAVGAAYVATRFARRRYALVLGMVIAGVIAASLVASILMTQFNPARAYFDSFVRGWEFAAGGLLAVLVTSGRGPLRRASRRARVALAWTGLGAVLVSALAFTSSTAFPGWIALLPVIGTMLVISADEPTGPGSPQGLLSRPFVQWTGDISYGIYLWHFPLIVLLPFAIERELTVLDGLAVAVASFLLAWASKVWVEDPFRAGAPRRWRHRTTFLATAGAMGALLILSMVGIDRAEHQIREDQAHVASQLQRGGKCLGPHSQREDSGCEPLMKAPPVPEPSLANEAPLACLGELEGSEMLVCEYGAKPDEATRTVALVGDSHAEQWLMALDRIAAQEGWRLLVFSKASCPFTTAERDFVSMPGGANATHREDCAEWNARVIETLNAEQDVDTLITSAKSTNRFVVENDGDWRELAARSYVDRWAELPDSVEEVIAIRDTPQFPADIMTCVTHHGEEAPEACAVPIEDAFHPDPIAEATVEAAQSNSTTVSVTLVDMSDYFVVEDEVPPVIGGVLAFRDDHHLSWAYSELLAEPLHEELGAALESSGTR